MVSQEDLVGAILLSIGFGKVTRILLFEPWVQKTLSTAVGFITVLAMLGIHIWQPMFSVAMQVILLRVLPTTHLHWVSFLCQFTHLTIFRLFFPNESDYVPMMLALKMVGLSLEVKEARLRSQPASLIDELVRNPSIVEVVHYSFCHAGIVAGPYFKFRTFQDMYYSPWSSKADCEGVVWQKITSASIFFVLNLVTSWICPISYISEEAFYTDTSLLYRLFYLNLVVFSNHMRYFCGFVLSECSCIMVGLGAYPSTLKPSPGNGPTLPLETMDILSKPGSTPGTDQIGIDFNTVRSVDVFAFQTVPTMGEAARFWNMTVQHWLVVNVYKQLPRSPYFPRPLRGAIVMLVCALWHGLHPGYYLGFCSCPLFCALEDLYKRLLNSILTSRLYGPMQGNVKWHPPPIVSKDTLVSAYNILAWVFRSQWSCYLGLPVILLRADITIKVWASVYYLGHLSWVAFYGAGLLLGHILKKF